MKKSNLILILILLLGYACISQINPKDSTVQVIGYWDKNEKQSFLGSYEKYKVKDSDTTFTLKCKYDIDITIKDSTETSYTIEWFYHNYKVEAENELIKKLSSLSDNMKVIIKTDELGVFLEVVNWQEIRDYMMKIGNSVKVELKSLPNIDKVMEQVLSPYLSKKGIESNALKDIQQFYTFHGGNYKLKEKLEGNLLTHNNYGETPFDTKVEVILDEIDEEEGNSIIRSYLVVDTEQLTNATYEYLNSLAQMNGQSVDKNDIPAVQNETYVASRIHGNTGWVIYTIQTRIVSAESTTNVEETILELK